MMDGTVTYADAARWLSPDVRQQIEVTRPCVDGEPHRWDTRAVDVTRMCEAAPQELRWWYCTQPDCGVSADTNPAEYDERWRP